MRPQSEASIFGKPIWRAHPAPAPDASSFSRRPTRTYAINSAGKFRVIALPDELGRFEHEMESILSVAAVE
jgi:hypothetical protein